MFDTNEDTRLFQQVTAQFDAPAFVRRARSVDDAWQRLVVRCETKRDELLRLPRLRLGVVLATAGDWSRVGGLLADPAGVHDLQELFTLWQPQLRARVDRANSLRPLAQALAQLCDSFERFNRKWSEFVTGIDLRDINNVRANYNKYYVLEKECSLRSAVLARQGFRALAALSSQDLFAEFPLLIVPRPGS